MKLELERVRLRDLDAEERRVIAGVAASALVRSRAFKHPHMWRLAVLVVEPNTTPRVTSRADWAAWLRANGLDEHARDVVHARVHRGELLAWILMESDLAFLKLDLSKAFK